MTDETAAIQSRWPQLLDVVKKRRRFTWILLSQNATVLAYDGTTLTLNMVTQGAYDNFVSTDGPTLLDEALAHVLGTRPALELLVDGKAPSTRARTMPGGQTAQVQVSVAVTAAAATCPEQSEQTADAVQLVLAQTAFLMYEQGNSQAAALLTDVEDVELVPGNRLGDRYEAVLIVPPYLVPRFTSEVIGAIQPVFDHVAGRHGLDIGAVTAAPALPAIGDDWRQILQQRLTQGTASNQASRTRAREVVLTFTTDGFAFESREEMLVYEALKRAQSQLPQDSTISIFPLPMGRVGIGNSWTPDFLVTLAGRIGLIEVDGPHHHKRFGADATRDRHWRNSGIIHIERILVEETSAGTDLDALVRQFLTRLREYR